MDRKDWPTTVSREFETPDRDDRAFYAGLTPPSGSVRHEADGPSET